MSRPWGWAGGEAAAVPAMMTCMGDLFMYLFVLFNNGD